MRFRYSAVNDWMAGSLVRPIHAILNFMPARAKSCEAVYFFFFRAALRTGLAEVDLLAALRETDFFAFAGGFLALAFLGARFRSAGPRRRAVFHKRSRS